MRSTLSHAIYEVKKIGRGLRKMKGDVSFAAGVQQKRINNKYRDTKYHEKVKVRQVKQDVMKFIPFSLFILIPGAELLLPPFLMVFPNSVPS